MGEIGVDTEAVESAAALLARQSVDFHGRVDALNSFASSVIGSHWSGAAADAFSTEFVTWVEGAREVHSALSRVSSLLTSSAETYATTERTVSSSARTSRVTTISSGRE